MCKTYVHFYDKFLTKSSIPRQLFLNNKFPLICAPTVETVAQLLKSWLLNTIQVLVQQLQQYNMQLPSALLSPSSEKKFKNYPKKFLIFPGMKLSGSKIKEFLIFLIFSQKKAFLRFLKKFFIFQETVAPKKISYISGRNSPGSKSKKNPLLKSSLCFGKWKFQPQDYKTSCISGENLKSLKIKQKSLLKVVS